jgi:hypothetical protein
MLRVHSTSYLFALKCDVEIIGYFSFAISDDVHGPIAIKC